MGFVMTDMIGKIEGGDISSVEKFLAKKLPNDLFRIEGQSIILEGYTEDFNFWGENGLDIIILELVHTFSDIKLGFKLSEEYSVGGGVNEIVVSYADKIMKVRVRDFLGVDSIQDFSYEEYLETFDYTAEQISKDEFERCKANNLCIYADPSGTFLFAEDKIPQKYYKEEIIKI